MAQPGGFSEDRSRHLRREGSEPQVLNEIERADAGEAYLEAGLRLSTDLETGDFLDGNHTTDDLDAEARERLLADLTDFIDAKGPTIVRIRAHHPNYSPADIGDDFWLTRNRHGAGFWDRGLGDDGDLLTQAAHVYGEVDLDVGDDGRIHT